MRTVFVIVLLFCTGLSKAQISQEASLKSLVREAINRGDELFINDLCNDATAVHELLFEPKEQNVLHIAARNHQTEIIRTLVSQCNFDPSSMDSSDTPSLFYARMSPETVKILLELGADPNQVVKKTPVPIISQFLINNVPRGSLDPFLEHDVNLTQKSATGMTPLMYAVLSRRKSNVEFLITAMEKGFDIAPTEEISDKGLTAADLASPQIKALLTAHGIK